jgi:tetratricopeptide (TPR) repeat protein
MKRFVIPAAALLAAPWLIYHLCYLPYRCNRQVGIAKAQTERAWERSGEIDAAIMARNLVAQMRGCVEQMPGCLGCYPEPVVAYMIIGANLRILKLPDQALAAYRQALAIDRRPELYLQMGNSLMEAGNREAALRYFTLAVTFNPQYIYDRSVLPPEVWEETYHRFIADEKLYRDHAVAHPTRSFD